MELNAKQQVSPMETVKQALSSVVLRWVLTVALSFIAGVGGFILGTYQDFSSLNSRVGAIELTIEPIPDLIDTVEIFIVKVETLIEILN